MGFQYKTWRDKQDEFLLRKIRANRQLTLSQPNLFAVAYHSFTGNCDNCTGVLNNRAVCVLRVTQERKYHKIAYLCSNCRSINEKNILFYLILKE